MALTLSSAQTSVAEGGALAFSVAATADDNKTLFKPLSWVVLDAAGGVAASGDFAAAFGALSPINHGKTSRDFVVTALADRLFEGGAETYTVQVRSDTIAGDPMSGTLEATATFAVQDGDGEPAYSIADAAPVAEGGELVFTVTASAAAADPQTVSYRVDGGEAQTLAIPAGETAAEIRVQTQDDAVQGSNPAVVVELVSASVGTASGSATGAVADNDGEASVYSASGGGTALEGGMLAFTVTRTGGLGAETVTYTLGGTAAAGSDHAAPSGSVAFGAGELTRTIQIRTYLDSVVEADETIALTLGSASNGGRIEGASASGAVTDLDLAGALRRQVAVEAGPEGNVAPSADALRFADGWLALDGGTELGSALRLYQATLGRDPDPIGLGFWTDALEAGTITLAEAAQGFVGSVEFQARYGAPDNAGFVDLLYRNVLGRAADAEGHAHWKNGLDNGALTRVQVVLGFSDSAELKAATAADYSTGVWAAAPVAVDVMRYYETVLDRLPDAGGLLHWVHVREQGLTLGQMADAFTGSAEFEARYGALTNQGFVERLYLNALDRPGEAEGIAHWTGALDAGALSRAAVATGFAMSQEMAVKLTPFVMDGAAFV